jgi:murein DD-endopeptidase MepM/ murein hydrolase activator NlpD
MCVSRTTLALLALIAPFGAALAQSAVKYRDANGQWIFTDQAAGSAGAATETLHLSHEAGAPRIDVAREDKDGVTRLIATNRCLCTANVRVRIFASQLAGVPAGSSYSAAVAAGETRALMEVHADAQSGNNNSLRYRWSATLGSPQAMHNPPRPYRAPFAVGATFTVTQAWPARSTHVAADSFYAVDIALPDGTPVYAARAGLVIDLRHDAFLGAVDPTLLDQANVVEILHDDGTIAVYAHLHWDSIRVRIGQQVARGEYLADSGNTGFTSGPHLHFAVWRNSDNGEIAVPVVFEGPGGSAVTPATAVALTAY